MNKIIIAALLAVGAGVYFSKKKTTDNNPPPPPKPDNDPKPGGSTKNATDTPLPDIKSNSPAVVVSPQGPVMVSTDFLQQRKAALIKTMAGVGLPQATVATLTDKVQRMSDNEVGTMENFMRSIATRQPLSQEGFRAVSTLNQKYNMFPAGMLAAFQPK